MKKIIYILTAVVSAFTLASCSKMLDSVEQLGALDTDKYYTEASDAEAEAIATSMYVTVWNQLSNTRMEAYTDNVVSTNGYKTINADNFDSGLYAGLYQLIYKTHLVIEKLPGDTPVKQRTIAEAYFFRGWAYFNLIRGWGTPPYVDHVLSAEDLTAITNGNKEELWKLCTDSFEEAVKGLPSKSGKGGQQAIGARVTKQAAQAFLGKAYLYAGNKSAAASALKQVIDSQAYSLIDDFQDLYTMKADWSDEYVWEYNADDNDADQRGTEARLDYQSQWRGENLTQPGGCHLSGFTQGFSNSFPSKDFYDFMIARGEGNGTRRLGTVWSVEEAAQKFVDLSDPSLKGTPNYEGDNLAAMKAAHPGITDFQAGMRLLWSGDMALPSASTCQGYLGCKQYIWFSDMYPATNTHDIYSKANYPVMRYSDVLLLYAEAASDVNALNQVRQRAGLAALGSYSDQALRDERRAEFWGEGERFWDCIRWGIAATEFASVGKVSYETTCNSSTYEVTVNATPVSDWIGWDNKYTAFPYTTSELQQTSIKQNPGWE